MVTLPLNRGGRPVHSQNPFVFVFDNVSIPRHHGAVIKRWYVHSIIGIAKPVHHSIDYRIDIIRLRAIAVYSTAARFTYTR